MALPSHKTRIVCTVGPSCDSSRVLGEMIRSGMNVARLNFSHGDFAYHRQLIEAVRRASAATGRRVAIMADLPGPRIRVGELANDTVELRTGERFSLTTERVAGDRRRVSVDFDQLPRSVKPGDTVFLKDGYIQLRVDGTEGNEVRCRVVAGGELHSRNGVNLPGIDLGTGAFTDRDRDCLAFALEQGVDAVSQSFVQSADDIHDLRHAAAALGHRPFVIAKIERRAALDVIDDIIEAADGIMIARGDLGVEVPIERIAVVQKDLIRRANRQAKPVITATQMLESMTQNPRPTRAEATDVANAILDGTDCVMLSGESAVGNYPVEAVATLADIAVATEPGRRRVAVRDLYPDVEHKGAPRPAQLLALAVEATLRYATPAAVFVPTLDGAAVRRIARFRPPVWLIAVSPEDKCCQDLQFTCGVEPVKRATHPEDWTAFIRDCRRELQLQGEIVLLASGPSPAHPNARHRLEILTLDGQA